MQILSYEKIASWWILLIPIIIVVLTACEKEEQLSSQPVQPQPTQQNKWPVVNAGPDQVITLPIDSIKLSGTATDPDGSVIVFRWNKVSGPSSFTIISPNDSATKVKNLVEGVYKFELKVTDKQGSWSTDTVSIVVNLPEPGNYRSKQSGDWRNASNWQRFDGANWVDAATAPSYKDGKINILAGHTIRANSYIEVNQLVIDTGGVLIIAADFTIDGYGNDLINNGTLDWQKGTVNIYGIYTILTIINNGNFLLSGNDDTFSEWWDSDVRIVNNGIITKTSQGYSSLESFHSVTNTSTGVIQGLGTIGVSGDISWLPGVFKNKGTIAPGLPIGTLAINGVLEPFSSESKLNIDVRDNSGPASGHDELRCNKNILLNGTLTVTEIGSTVANGRFTILTTSGTINGNFLTTDVPAGYSVQVKTNSVELVKQK